MMDIQQNEMMDLQENKMMDLLLEMMDFVIKWISYYIMMDVILKIIYVALMLHQHCNNIALILQIVQRGLRGCESEKWATLFFTFRLKMQRLWRIAPEE